MNDKLRTLAQSLISELNESKGVKDVAPSEAEWWRQLDWKSPDSQTLFDSLGKETQELIIEAGLAKDDLVSEEHQGNAEQMTPSKRARLFFSISEPEWDLLSEEEKLDYISRMEAKKERAGGEEMSNRDCVYPWDVVREKLLQKVSDMEMAKVEPMMLQRIITALVFDGDSVTITAETRDKLIEYGIDLDPCECDDAEADEGIETDETIEEDAGDESAEDSTELETDEVPSKNPLSTDQILQETDKVLRDIKRLVD